MHHILPNIAVTVGRPPSSAPPREHIERPFLFWASYSDSNNIRVIVNDFFLEYRNVYMSKVIYFKWIFAQRASSEKHISKHTQIKYVGENYLKINHFRHSNIFIFEEKVINIYPNIITRCSSREHWTTYLQLVRKLVKITNCAILQGCQSQEVWQWPAPRRPLGGHGLRRVGGVSALLLYLKILGRLLNPDCVL